MGFFFSWGMKYFCNKTCKLFLPLAPFSDENREIKIKMKGKNNQQLNRHQGSALDDK